MRTVVIYREESEVRRALTDFLRDFERQTGRELETLDPDSQEGTDFCRTYDIVEYPTVIAIDDDGIMQNSWSGTPLPTISEVSYYA